MRGRIGLIILVGILLVSCSGNAAKTTPPVVSLQSLSPSPAPTEQITRTSTQGIPTGTAMIPSPQEISAPGCPADDASKIGRSIADSYPFSTADEVTTWFCQGAEFEDIMVALETEELNGTPAEDMLQMRAEGMSWDEIWLAVGFLDI